MESWYFGELGAHATFQNPRVKPSGRKVRAEGDKKKNAVNSGHYILTTMPKCSSCTSVGPLLPEGVSCKIIQIRYIEIN